MTVGTAWPYDTAAYDDPRLVVSAAIPQILRLPAAIPQQILGAAALTCIAFTCAWALCGNLGGSAVGNNGPTRSDRLPFADSREDKLTIASLRGSEPSDVDLADFDSRFAAAFPPGVYLGSTPFADDAQVAALPEAPFAPTLGRRVATTTRSPVPRGFAPRWRPGRKPSLPEIEQQTEAIAEAPAARPSLFQRIFGRLSPSSSIFEKLYGPAPSKVTLAYAGPEDAADTGGASVTTGLFDRQTAVYDISTHTVYLPDGRALEAHSGYGSLLDNPHSAAARDRGVTPPDIYDLQPRGRLFHGVQALRLLPEDQSKVFGRSGLLAHTYMLGPSGQSNGCVSFKDYDAFLQAYEDHEITRLAVVSRVD
jgi:hypothetical protein